MHRTTVRFLSGIDLLTKMREKSADAQRIFLRRTQDGMLGFYVTVHDIIPEEPLGYIHEGRGICVTTASTAFRKFHPQLVRVFQESARKGHYALSQSKTKPYGSTTLPATQLQRPEMVTSRWDMLEPQPAVVHIANACLGSSHMLTMLRNLVTDDFALGYNSNRIAPAVAWTALARTKGPYTHILLPTAAQKKRIPGHVYSAVLDLFSEERRKTLDFVKDIRI